MIRDHSPLEPNRETLHQMGIASFAEAEAVALVHGDIFEIDGKALDTTLDVVASQCFHNHSELDFARLKGESDRIAQHLAACLHGFSGNARDIFEYFEFQNEFEKMDEANILLLRAGIVLGDLPQPNDIHSWNRRNSYCLSTC